MVSVNEFIKRLSGLEYYTKKLATEALFKASPEIVKQNNAELMRGKNTKGETIQKGYSKYYGKKRKEAGLQTQFVDLKFSGKFQDTSKGVKVVEGLDIESGVDYEKHIRKRFENIRGLNDKQAEIQASKIAEELIEPLKKYLTT